MPGMYDACLLLVLRSADPAYSLARALEHQTPITAECVERYAPAPETLRAVEAVAAAYEADEAIELARTQGMCVLLRDYPSQFEALGIEVEIEPADKMFTPSTVRSLRIAELPAALAAHVETVTSLAPGWVYDSPQTRCVVEGHDWDVLYHGPAGSGFACERCAVEKHSGERS